MNVLKLALVPAALALLLCACGAPATQESVAGSAPAAATNNAPATDAEKTAQLREEFIRTCTETAAHEESDTSKETFAEVCRCTFDDTAIQYGSDAALTQALSDYDSGKSDGNGLEAKMTAAANQCADRLLPK